jgi:hypothetical protein
MFRTLTATAGPRSAPSTPAERHDKEKVSMPAPMNRIAGSPFFRKIRAE